MTSNIHRLALGAAAISSLLLLQAGCEANSAEPPDQPAPVNGSALPDSKVANPEPVKPSLPEALPALSGDHFGVWDLRHNLPLAHRIERIGEDIVAPFDTTAPDFIRYVNGNYPNDWMIGVTVEDVKSAGIKARKANLWVPTWRPTAGAQAHRAARTHCGTSPSSTTPARPLVPWASVSSPAEPSHDRRGAQP